MSDFNDIYINSLGQQSAAGQGIKALRAALAGETKVVPTILQVATAKGDVAVPVYAAPETVLPDSIPESVKRRMARMSRMCFASLSEALTGAFGPNMEELRRHPERIGLVVGTAFGCMQLANTYQRRIILEGYAGASPSLFASSIHNSLAAHLSISFGIQGPNSTTATMEHTTMGALQLACAWLNQGHLDHVAVLIGDELSDYHSYFAAHTSGPTAGGLDPYSDACTASPGEGVVCLLLSKTPLKPFAKISEVSLFRETPPQSERYFAGVWGAEKQWSQMQSWLGPHTAESHLPLYGSMICGLAFEIAIATLKVAEDARPTSCVQVADGAGQSISLVPATSS